MAKIYSFSKRNQSIITSPLYYNWHNHQCDSSWCTHLTGSRGNGGGGSGDSTIIYQYYYSKIHHNKIHRSIKCSATLHHRAELALKRKTNNLQYPDQEEGLTWPSLNSGLVDYIVTVLGRRKRIQSSDLFLDVYSTGTAP